MTHYIIMDHSHGVQQFDMAPRTATDAGIPVVPQVQHVAHVLSTENAKNSCAQNAAQLQVTDSGIENTQLKDNVVADDDPILDIVINNVVCCFTTRCHLNLKRIAQEGMNVIYRRDCGMVSMKLRKPSTTASIWSSGKITCTGATSEEQALVAARKIARSVEHLGFKVKFKNFRVVNVLGTCSMPFGINITKFSCEHKESASYEPELHPGVTYRIKNPKATLKIFSTGSITVTAPCIANIQSAIEHIYTLVLQYKMAKPPPKSRPQQLQSPVIGGAVSRNRFLPMNRQNVARQDYSDDDEDSISCGSSMDDFDSDASQN